MKICIFGKGIISSKLPSVLLEVKTLIYYLQFLMFGALGFSQASVKESHEDHDHTLVCFMNLATDGIFVDLFAFRDCDFWNINSEKKSTEHRTNHILAKEYIDFSFNYNQSLAVILTVHQVLLDQIKKSTSGTPKLVFECLRAIGRKQLKVAPDICRRLLNLKVGPNANKLKYKRGVAAWVNRRLIRLLYSAYHVNRVFNLH